MKFDGKPRLTEEETLAKKPVLAVNQIIDDISND
jgi:hypothetical protein